MLLPPQSPPTPLVYNPNAAVPGHSKGMARVRSFAGCDKITWTRTGGIECQRNSCATWGRIVDVRR
jgi:hypothetical protein